MKTEFDVVRFSITLKVWRNMNGFTSREVAEAAGMAASTYSFVETGDRAPTMAEFSHLCSLIGFDAATFFKTPEKPVK